MSQQAVADAMQDRGFNWRQTTVAKTEGADRPTLFTEVAALSTILKRELGYFLNGRTALDEVKEEAAVEVRRAEGSLTHAQNQVAYWESEVARALIVHGAALAVSEFSYTLDTSELKNSFEIFASSSAFTVPMIKRVLEAAGVPVRMVEEADQAALRVAAQAIQRGKNVKEGRSWGFSDKELAENIVQYLSDVRTPSHFTDFLRSRSDYKAEACRIVVDDLIVFVESRRG